MMAFFLFLALRPVSGVLLKVLLEFRVLVKMSGVS
jgi:hypothetical protein